MNIAEVKKLQTHYQTISLRFAIGYGDGYHDFFYNDGMLPPHRFQVCIPTDDDYRDGYLAGLADRIA